MPFGENSVCVAYRGNVVYPSAVLTFKDVDVSSEQKFTKEGNCWIFNVTNYKPNRGTIDIPMDHQVITITLGDKLAWRMHDFEARPPEDIFKIRQQEINFHRMITDIEGRNICYMQEAGFNTTAKQITISLLDVKSPVNADYELDEFFTVDDPLHHRGIDIPQEVIKPNFTHPSLAQPEGYDDLVVRYRTINPLIQSPWFASAKFGRDPSVIV